VEDIIGEAGELLNASGAIRDKYMKSLKLSTEQIVSVKSLGVSPGHRCFFVKFTIKNVSLYYND